MLNPVAFVAKDLKSKPVDFDPDPKMEDEVVLESGCDDSFPNNPVLELPAPNTDVPLEVTLPKTEAPKVGFPEVSFVVEDVEKMEEVDLGASEDVVVV